MTQDEGQLILSLSESRQCHNQFCQAISVVDAELCPATKYMTFTCRGPSKIFHKKGSNDTADYYKYTIYATTKANICAEFNFCPEVSINSPI